MPADPLREKLKALVEEWRHTGRHSDRIRHAEAMGIFYCCDQLAALLAKSEPEPYPACSCHAGSVCGEACSRGKHHDGCSWEGWRSMPTNEAKAKLPLPLGHEFVPHTNGPERDCTLYQKCHYIGGPGLCGQPRSAHEPR